MMKNKKNMEGLSLAMWSPNAYRKIGNLWGKSCFVDMAVVELGVRIPRAARVDDLIKATVLGKIYQQKARKALRALRGLVKFQALVRGFLVRKRTAATLYRIQALFRAQVSILSQRAGRSSTDHRVITRYRKSTAGKALRALRGLMKFQALVKGFLVRKKTAATLYNIQALFRAQTAILSQWARCSFTDHGVTRHRKSIERFDQETYSRFAKSNRSIAPTTRTQRVHGDGYFKPYSNNRPSYMANTVIFGETKVS